VGSRCSCCLCEACLLEETQVALPGRRRGAGDASLQPHHFSELHGPSTSRTELDGTHLGEGRRLIQADVGEWNKGGSSAHRWGQTTAWLVFEDGGGREKEVVANALVARWYRSRCGACPPEFDPSLGRLGCRTGDFPQMGAGVWYVCVSSGRRVFEFFGSPSALSVRLA